MKMNVPVLIILLTLATGGAHAGGSAGWNGYPKAGVIYKFSVVSGEVDNWNSAEEDSPPLLPGKACRIAKEFSASVPLEKDMKKWRLTTIKLQKLSDVPECWIYVVHFTASPKAAVWNGPLPWIEVPVRMDGTIPTPVIEGNGP